MKKLMVLLLAVSLLVCRVTITGAQEKSASKKKQGAKTTSQRLPNEKKALAKMDMKDIVKVTASSYKESNKAENAFDENPTTRWESEWRKDPSWLAIELKEKIIIEALRIVWENASASVYKVETSDDGKKWNIIKKIEDGQSGEKRDIKLDKPVTTKYLRILGENRTLQEYGYSIFEVEINPIVLDETSRVRIIKAISSSTQAEGVTSDTNLSAVMSIDYNMNTRWGSEFSDPQWLEVELEKENKIKSVRICWETASAKVYSIQVSLDKNTWKDIAKIEDGKSGETKIINFAPIDARYIRINGETRNGGWGYSIWELEVYR